MLSHECKGEKFNVDYLQSPIHPVRARHPVTPPAGGRPRAEKRSRRAPLSMEHGAVATRRTDCCESFSPVLFSTQSPSLIRKMCGQRSMSPCTASYKPIRDLVDWVVWRYPVGPFFKEKDPAPTGPRVTTSLKSQCRWRDVSAETPWCPESSLLQLGSCPPLARCHCGDLCSDLWDEQRLYYQHLGGDVTVELWIRSKCFYRFQYSNWSSVVYLLDFENYFFQENVDSKKICDTYSGQS